MKFNQHPGDWCQNAQSGDGIVRRKIWCHDKIEQRIMWECVCMKLMIGMNVSKTTPSGIQLWSFVLRHARSQRHNAITMDASIRSKEENMERKSYSQIPDLSLNFKAGLF